MKISEMRASLGSHVRRRLAGVALSLCAPLAQAADTNQEIVWMALDLPPVLMIVDGQPTDGFVDVILKMVFAEMPETKHFVQLTPAARTWSNLSYGIPMCFATPLRTREREEKAYFASTQLIPPIQVVAREEVIEKLPRNAKGEVLPEVLFNHPDLHGLITPGRSYTQNLDTLLKHRAAPSSVHEVTATSSGSNILQMLSRGRADYTLEFDYVLTYQRLRHPDLQQGSPLKSLSIAGTQPQIAGIACPHTEWGRAMVIKLDAIVARISQRPEYQAALNRWLTPDVAKRYRKELAEFYRQRAQRADASEYPVWPKAR